MYPPFLLLLPPLPLPLPPSSGPLGISWSSLELAPGARTQVWTGTPSQGKVTTGLSWNSHREAFPDPPRLGERLFFCAP